MAGAVIEIEAVAPEKLPRQRIELCAVGAVGKYRAGDRDVALEHQGEILAHVRARRADRDGAGDIGGAVLVLAAGIDQKQFVGPDPSVGSHGDAIMHNCGVGAGAGDGGK